MNWLAILSAVAPALGKALQEPEAAALVQAAGHFVEVFAAHNDKLLGATGQKVVSGAGQVISDL